MFMTPSEFKSKLYRLVAEAKLFGAFFHLQDEVSRMNDGFELEDAIKELASAFESVREGSLH